jgi:hypothetical protein
MERLLGHRGPKGPATDKPTSCCYRATSRLYQAPDQHSEFLSYKGIFFCVGIPPCRLRRNRRGPQRHGHLKLDEVIRGKVLAMSAATIDRLLPTARNATRTRKPRCVTPEFRRRIPVRTFAD